MSEILNKIKTVLDKTGSLALSLAQEPSNQSLNQLLEKINILVKITKDHELKTWNKLMVYLLRVLNQVKAGKIIISEKLVELIINIFELLLEAVENANLQISEEVYQEMIDRLNQLLCYVDPAHISQTPEAANKMGTDKCFYGVSLKVKASADSPDLLIFFEKLTSCGEVIQVTVDESEKSDVSPVTGIPSFLSLQFYLSSNLSIHALENALRTVLVDSPCVQMNVYPVFEENSKYNNEEPEKDASIRKKPNIEITSEEKKTFQQEEKLTQEEIEVLELILAQQREYLEQPCNPEDFPQRALSILKILTGMGAYLNKPELKKKAGELLEKSGSGSSWQEEFLLLLNTVEKTARDLIAKSRTIPVRKTTKESKKSTSVPATKSIRVDEAKVDRLMALTGELTVTCNALLYMARKIEGEYGLTKVARELKEQHAGFDRLVRELQDAVMSMRLLPASYIFQKFRRMIRDLARELGKKVELRLEGEDTEIDKTVMETIGEPMVHLVRNSIDHGFEPPEERLGRGKTVEGIITLRAFREGSKIVLEVEDDGRGIDVERVRQKAVSAGLVPAEEARFLTEEQVLEFLFAPGFSTAEEVTKVSGRGVGMDAVRAAVRSLGGSVKIKTSFGAGTKVRLELPLTLATSHVLLVMQNGRKYGLPLSDVKETVKIHANEISSMRGKRIAVIRDELVPVFFLGEFFGDKQKEINNEELCLVILTDGFAFVVDKFLGQEDIVVKPLTLNLSFDSCFAGAAILGDGSILLVLDPHRMWQQLSANESLIGGVKDDLCY